MNARLLFLLTSFLISFSTFAEDGPFQLYPGRPEYLKSLKSMNSASLQAELQKQNLLVDKECGKGWAQVAASAVLEFFPVLDLAHFYYDKNLDTGEKRSDVVIQNKWPGFEIVGGIFCAPSELLIAGFEKLAQEDTQLAENLKKCFYDTYLTHHEYVGGMNSACYQAMAKATDIGFAQADIANAPLSSTPIGSPKSTTIQRKTVHPQNESHGTRTPPTENQAGASRAEPE